MPPKNIKRKRGVTVDPEAMLKILENLDNASHADLFAALLGLRKLANAVLDKAEDAVRD